MSDRIFPDLPASITLQVDRPVNYATGIQQAASGVEYRALWMNRPRTRWRLNVEVMKTASPYQWQELVNFYQSHGGRFDSFLYSAPDDFTIPSSSPMLFGEGDGSTTAFQLQRTLSTATRFRSNLFFSYTPGDSITALGGTFSRASTATYTDKFGIVRTALSGEVRDANYFSGSRTLLLEYSATNLCTRSQEFDQWTEVGTCAVTTNALWAPDGTTTADLLTGGLIGLRQKTITFGSDGEKAFSIYAYPAATPVSTDFTIRDTTASVSRIQVRMAWTNGVPSLSIITGTGNLYAVEAMGTTGWYRIKFSADALVAANTNVWQITPDGPGGVGSVYLWGAQAENSFAPSSYIPTVAATVTRQADELYFPWSPKPQAMTVYNDFYDLTNIGEVAASNSRIFQIGNAANDDPRVMIYRDSVSPGYVGLYDPGASSSTTAVLNGGPSDAAVYGARVQARAALSTLGAITLGIAVNGTAEVTASGSNQGFPSAWSSPARFYIGPFPTSTLARGAYRRIIVLAGAQTLATCVTEAALSSEPVQFYPDFGDGYEPIEALNGAPVIYRDNTALIPGIDYTYDDSGLVTFTTAPADGARLAWSGSYYWRVRFDSDAWATGRIVSGLWEAPSLDLIQVLS